MGKRLTGRIIAAGTLAALGMIAPLGLGELPARSMASSPFDGEIANFYRARGGAPLWLAPTAGAAAPQLIQLLATAQADHLNPRRYNVKVLQRALADAQS